jgi:ParB family transcriptional regulator, chromosome partitioning protein
VMKPLSFFKSRCQPRKSFDQKELNALGMSMKVRQLQPLVCLRDGTIICGERRFRAAQLVGMTHLEVRIIEEDLSETQIAVCQLTENMQREGLSGPELWGGCVELKRLNPTWSNRDLAEQLHKDPSMITRILSPSDCISAVQVAFAAGRLGISDCYAISKLPPEQQESMLAKKLSGASRDSIESLGRKHRNGSNATVKTKRIKCMLASGVTVVVSAEGDLSLEDMIEGIAELAKLARKASQDGLDARTFQAVCRDRAKAGG